MTRDGVNYRLKKLKEGGVVVRIGSKTDSRWEISSGDDGPYNIELLSLDEQIQMDE